MSIILPSHSGWLFEQDHARLADLESASASLESVRLFAGENEIPDEIDPTGWYRDERQQRNDCRGFSGSTSGEGLFARLLGYVIQFSPHAMYRLAQEIDGIRSDSGSTLSGGLEALKRWGWIPLSVCPYPSSYNSPITQAMRDAGAPYKIAGHTMPKTYQDVLEAVAFLGPVDFGCGWKFQTGSSGFVLEKFLGNGPGHATSFGGISPRKDRSGRPYIKLLNSGYPTPGVYEVSPDAVQGILDDRWSVAICYTKLATPKPKKMAYDLFNSPTGAPSTENIA